MSEAARILHVSQPTLSTHISQLEKDLGVSLVNRGKGFRLTATGRRFVDGISTLLDDFDRLVEELRAMNNTSADLLLMYDDVPLRASVTYQFFLSEFLRMYPQCYLRQEECHYDSVYKALTEGHADCVVVFFYPIAEDLEKGVEFAKIPSTFPNHLYRPEGLRFIKRSYRYSLPA